MAWTRPYPIEAVRVHEENTNIIWVRFPVAEGKTLDDLHRYNMADAKKRGYG